MGVARYTATLDILFSPNPSSLTPPKHTKGGADEANESWGDKGGEKEACSPGFLLFSLLVPHVHREGPVGQQARDALLLMMSLSANHESIARQIVEHSDFCLVS